MFLDEKLSGGANVVFNPLWTLLTIETLSRTDTLRYAGYLPFNVQKRLLSVDRKNINTSTRTIFQLAHLNSFDALNALIILLLSHQNQIGSIWLDYINREITNLIVRLFTLRYEYHQLGFKLITALLPLFKDTEPHICNRT